MPLENPIPPFDFKELRNICAVLSIELLQNVVEKTKILFFLQCIEIQNEELSNWKIPEVTNFLQSKREFGGLSCNIPADSVSQNKIAKDYLKNTRKLWAYLSSHKDVLYKVVVESLSQNNKHSVNPINFEIQQWPLSTASKDFINILNYLHKALFKEFHYKIDSLKYIERLIKERESSCRELKSIYDKLTAELDNLQKQREEKMRELDLQVQRVQNKHAHLSEAFAESTRQITAKGVEDFEKTKKQFQIILEHLKSELAVAKERVDDDLLSNVNGVKINRSKKFRLESQLESQIATYDKEMTALRKQYDEMIKRYDVEKAQLEDYQDKMAAIRLEHEAVLTQKEAERERERAIAARDAAVTEATQLITIYACAFLARRATAAKKREKSQRRGRH